VATNLGQEIKQQPTTRADLARQFLARLDRLAPRLNKVSLAAEVQLLKRELARSHSNLSARSEDNNFLSVVTLVEAALASITWKSYTPGMLDVLRQAFSAGLHEGEFTFEEYDAIRRTLESRPEKR
jgi:hypothetical protein